MEVTGNELVAHQERESDTHGHDPESDAPPSESRDIQQPALPVLMLQEAVSAALDHSPGLEALDWLAVATYEQSLSISARRHLALNFSVLGYQTNSPLGVFGARLSQGRVTQQDFDPSSLNDPSFLGNLDYSLKAGIPIYDSGRIRLAAEALACVGNATEEDLRGAEQELAVHVILLYIGHTLLQDQVRFLESALSTVQEYERLATSLEGEGLVVKADIATAQVEVANVENELCAAQTDLSLVGSILGMLMGSGASEFVTGISIEPEGLPERTLTEAVDSAKEFHPSVLAMEYRVSAAAKMLEEARRRRNPVIGAFAVGKHSSPGMPGEGHSELMAGAELSLDLDTNNALDHEIEQRCAELEAAKSALEQAKMLAGIQGAQTQAEDMKARGAVRLFAKQGERARENLRVTENRYREGQCAFFELRMAHTLAKESSLREMAARYDCLSTYYQLSAAMGMLDDCMQSLPLDTTTSIEVEAANE